MEQNLKAERGDIEDPYNITLKKHASNLPNWLYILSFAPPVPSPIHQTRQFISHPYTLYAIGTVAALVAGVGLPVYDIVLGYWADGIRKPGVSAGFILGKGDMAGWLMAVVGAVFVITFTTFATCFPLAGITLTNHLREQYLAAVLVQDQAYFDRIGPGEIVTRANRDVDSIRTGLGERLGYLIWSLSIMITTFVSGFVHSPKLAGVLFCLIPITMGILTGLGYWSDAIASAKLPLDGKASTLIEQMISSVRIVQSFDMGPRLLAKLEHGMLGPLRIMARKKAAANALVSCTVYGAGFLVYSLAFWYGGIVVAKGLSVGYVLTTFGNFINLFFTIAGIVPHMVAITAALQNISNLRLQIERQPPIDVRDSTGIKFGKDAGWNPSFQFEDVTFAYPARPAHKALDVVSITIDPGKFTAFVGPSGSGKSTLAALLLRFYDPETAGTFSELDQHIIKTIRAANGEKKVKSDQIDIGVPGETIAGAGVIKFAGHDVRTLNTRWLRSQVAVVLQNPQLLGGSIFDNVAAGLTGTDLEYREDIDKVPNPSPEVSARLDKITQRVEVALRKAQAWDFVQSLPDGINTRVAAGRTGVLSGGQVQRIALATALVRQPKCLLLDEATSAVSTDTELKIQETLLEEQKTRGMTLIVIAHRLSTIVAADKIVVMVAGRAVHSGTYDELLDPNCPDQTFRSMALATPVAVADVPSGNELSSIKSASSVTLDQPNLVSEKPNIPLANKKQDKVVPLPKPMKSVGEAFWNTKTLLFLGVILGITAGALFVLVAYIYGRGVSALNEPDIPRMRGTVNRWSLWFLVVAIASATVTAIYAYGLEYSGDKIVSDLRRESVRALIKRDIAFFESPETETGTGGLTAAVSSHPANVGTVIGLILAQFINSSSNLIATIIVAFVLSWRMAVMVLPTLSMTVALGYANFRCTNLFEANIVEENSAQASFVGDAVNSVNFLASLTREAETSRQFKVKYTSKAMDRKWLVWASLAIAGAQGMTNFSAGLIFYWGAKNLAQGKVTLANLFTVIESVIVAVYVSAKVLTYTGDFTRMRTSLHIIQVWMDRVPKIDSRARGEMMDKPQMEAKAGIEIKDAELRYPSRPDVVALNKVSFFFFFHIQPGKSYAFCGMSGAGKSSILAVLQRFYDITSGSVLLDGMDIREMDLKSLRSQMGYVSQEAILFEETVRWNLISGAVDPSSVTEADLEWACEQACILPFIRSLPLGFETDLGLKGGQLSGGQRQRLCIARALLRNPRILLLDEATSALDGESEASVQRAIDNASAGRMTITVAHRLSTIRKADVIFVMEQGRIVETGSHDELLKLNGKYLELVQAQL